MGSQAFLPSFFQGERRGCGRERPRGSFPPAPTESGLTTPAGTRQLRLHFWRAYPCRSHLPFYLCRPRTRVFMAECQGLKSLLLDTSSREINVSLTCGSDPSAGWPCLSSLTSCVLWADPPGSRYRALSPPTCWC